jgi:(1->4)-alpha-D-glucan 1-alpha-D-glucosylmutase
MNATHPASTYRLQLNSTFTFDDAREIVDYLANLGIGACYTSPILKARRGSLHGYDVIDHSELNPEIGSMETLRRFVDRLKQFGMGLILDIVPNHMCVADLSNSRWLDVLENGPSSPHARFFDVDWYPPREDLANKVLLPILAGGSIRPRARNPADSNRIRIGRIRGALLCDVAAPCTTQLD